MLSLNTKMQNMGGKCPLHGHGNESLDIAQSFKWLHRDLRGPAYISYNAFRNRSGCSFDFGADGYAGSCNHGGELLQMTATSDKHGIIFARGDFLYTLYSAIARGQKTHSGSSTFGLVVASSSSKISDSGAGSAPATVKWGYMTDRGCFNYRWPLNEYSLVLSMNKTARQGTPCREEEVGTCTTLSFVRGHVLYQVMKFDQEHRPSVLKGHGIPTECQAVVRIGGPIRFQTFSEQNARHETATLPTLVDGKTLTYKWDDNIRLDMKLYEIMDGGKFEEVTMMPASSQASAWYEANVKFPRPAATGAPKTPSQEIKLVPAVLVAAVRLTDGTRTEPLPDPPTSKEMYNYLGIDPASYDATGPMWQAVFLDGKDISPLPETHIIGRCLEKILQVDAVPIFKAPTCESSAHNSRANEHRPPEKAVIGKVVASAHHDTAKGRLQNGDISSQELSHNTGSPGPDANESLTEHIATRASMAKTTPSKVLFSDPFGTNGTFTEEPTVDIQGMGNPTPRNAVPRASILRNSVPTVQPTQFPAHQHRVAREVCAPKHEDRPVALVSNLFLRANVDLKALFWKLRFLVQVHKFLWTLSAEPSDDVPQNLPSPELWSNLRGTAPVKAQSDRVETYIKAVVSYLVEALLKPGSAIRLLPDNFVPAEPNYYYVMMTIWYAVKHCGRIQWTWKDTMSSWAKERGLLCDSDRLPPDNWNFEVSAKDKVAFLMWYHYGSMLRLVELGSIPSIWVPDLDQAAKKVERLGRAAKLALCTQITSQRPYIPDDELVDRLAFIAQRSELDLERASNSDLSTVEIAMMRLERRDYTRSLNPGCLPRELYGPTSGPWEIHALCHNGNLMVATHKYRMLDKKTQPKDSDAEAKTFGKLQEYKHNLCWFLTSEATLLPCWERTHMTARRGWLRAEATSIIASTLLELYLPESKLDQRHEHSSRRLSLSHTRSNSFYHGTDESKALDDQTQDSTKPGQAERRRDALERGELPLPPPIEWTKFCPPRKYHPRPFFNSLEDTPSMYTAENLRSMIIPPALKRHLRSSLHCTPGLEPGESSEEIMAQDFDKKSVGAAKGLSSVYVVDFKVRDTLLVDENGAYSTRKDTYEAKDKRRRRAIRRAATHFAPLMAGPYIPKHRLDIPEDNTLDMEITSDDAKKLTRVLCDSLVDQEVQHRLIAVREFSEDLLRLFSFVLHPESIDCFENHCLMVSRFSYQRTWQSWVCRITLRSWSLRTSSDESDQRRESTPGRGNYGRQRNHDGWAFEDTTIMLPKGLMEPLQRVNKQAYDNELREPRIIVPQVSSIVLSTNTFGDFSQCSLFSELIPKEELDLLCDEIDTLWDQFVHQPQTGRCLYFLLVLGLLCQRIADESKNAMDHFVSIINLEKSFINDESAAWIEDKNSVGQVKLGIWSLESLCKLRNTLESSMESIDAAKAELRRQISEGPGQRSGHLEQICQEYLQISERNIGELKAVNLKLNRTVELNSRYRDSLSTVLALRDSQSSLSDSKTSIAQNETIQKLTYMTIVYLPVSLAAAVFAIPDDQNVVYDHMGRGWFVGTVTILFVMTSVVTAFMTSILKYLSDFGNYLKKNIMGSNQNRSLNGEDSTAIVGVTPRDIYEDGRRSQSHAPVNAEDWA